VDGWCNRVSPQNEFRIGFPKDVLTIHKHPARTIAVAFDISSQKFQHTTSRRK
jgi:hypothetical protein